MLKIYSVKFTFIIGIAVDRTHASQSELKIQDGKNEAFKRLYQHAKNRFSSMNLGVSGDMDKNIKINDFSLNLGHRDYNEKAGPGAYDLPPLLGNQTIIDSIHNPPAYSIGTQDKKKLLALSKDQANSLKGLESPGV